MWKKQKLKLSPQAKQVLDNAQRGMISPFSLSTTGTKLGVHNWSHGIKEKSNHYLSPENAIKALAEKLVDYADPNRPTGQQDVLVIMVSHSQLDRFLSELDAVRVILPEPTFKQAFDYAKSSQDLQATKMIKTPTMASPAFSKSADITPGSARVMQGILRNVVSAVNATQAADPSAIIEALLAAKREREARNQAQVAQLLASQAEVFAFSAHNFLDICEAQLKANIPAVGNVFTAAVMFIGNDLSSIKEMLHDE